MCDEVEEEWNEIGGVFEYQEPKIAVVVDEKKHLRIVEAGHHLCDDDEREEITGDVGYQLCVGFHHVGNGEQSARGVAVDVGGDDDDDECDGGQTSGERGVAQSAERVQPSQNEEQKNARHTQTATGETIIDHHHETRESKKIFDDSDGEYVEFEEA